MKAKFERQLKFVKVQEDKFMFELYKHKGYNNIGASSYNAKVNWWKSIDKKLELEQDIKVLEKKVINDLMKEIK